MDNLEQEINYLKREEQEIKRVLNKEKMVFIKSLQKGLGNEMINTIYKRKNINTFKLKWLVLKQKLFNIFFKN